MMTETIHGCRCLGAKLKITFPGLTAYTSFTRPLYLLVVPRQVTKISWVLWLRSRQFYTSVSLVYHPNIHVTSW